MFSKCAPFYTRVQLMSNFVDLLVTHTSWIGLPHSEVPKNICVSQGLVFDTGWSLKMLLQRCTESKHKELLSEQKA